MKYAQMVFSPKYIKLILAIPVLTVWMCDPAAGQEKRIGYSDRGPDESLAGNVTEVTAPGIYDQPGMTYKLMNDISSERSAVFLGRDVTLDLNGYTITFADGDYEQIPNSGFEEGLTGWDVSDAPGAEVLDTRDSRIFIGEKLLSLQAGDELVSPYIHLPVSGRSYYAMAGMTGRLYDDMDGNLHNDMKISIFVEDEQGNNVEVVTDYGDSTMVSTPVQSRSTRLGGGFILAHLNNLPAGKYRVRVRAETDCLIDEVDIRPGLDVGVGIVGNTHPMGHYDHFYDIKHSAFFDYTGDVSKGTPLPGIPQIEGEGTVTIKNGVIKNGTPGMVSWGIQSTADNVRVILDNVKIENSGINAIAVDVPHATITHSTFDVDNPQIVNRHGSQFYGVDLRGSRPSEVSFSEFYGGQGCLVFKGERSIIHNNRFVNRQRVTNHYSIMAMGNHSMIFNNTIEPESGSGIEIYRRQGIRIFNNRIAVRAAPRTTEYHDHFSTNAFRIADYGAEKGDPDGAFDNRVYNNRIEVTGRKFAEYPDYIPVASAFFYSASAGDDFIYGNDIVLRHEDPDTDAEAYAFFIGNADGAEIRHNRIQANVTPIWIGTSYSDAAHIDLFENRISGLPGSRDFKPVRIGNGSESGKAREITLRSNLLSDMDFEVEDDGLPVHRYSVSWTLEVFVTGENGTGLPDEEVRIENVHGGEVFRGQTDSRGRVAVSLLEYSVDNGKKTESSPYTLFVRDQKKQISIDQNRSVTIVIS